MNNEYIRLLLAWLGGFLISYSIFYTPEPKTTTYIKSQVDHERYYCHETGFLMHHWELQKDKGNWIDTMERNRWEEPIKCELPE